MTAHSLRSLRARGMADRGNAGVHGDLIDETVQGLNRLSRGIAFSHGAVRALLCLFAGAAGGLAQAPLYALPALIVAFGVFVWVLDGLDETWQGRKQVFFAGWCFGLGYFAAVMPWIWGVALAPTDFAGWAMVAAPLVPLFLLALVPAMAGLAAHLFWTAGPERVLTLAVSWCAFDWIRGQIFGGFPWGFAGYAWANNLAMMQTTAWIGIYGLSFLTVVLAVSFVVLLENPSVAQTHLSDSVGARRRLSWQNFSLPIGAILAFICLYFGGVQRLHETSQGPGGDIFVRITPLSEAACSSNVAAASGSSLFRDVDTNADLPQPDLIIAVDNGCQSRFISEDKEDLLSLGEALRSNQLLAVLSERRSQRSETNLDAQLFGSVHIVSGSSQILATYDKTRLFPIRDFVPLRKALARFQPPGAVNWLNDKSAGVGPRTFSPGIVPEFGALIGFDAAYPGAVVDPKRRPEWLLHMTDETWLRLGGSAQTFDMARSRAIEEGLPMVRAARSGFSAVLDPYGRVISAPAPGGAGVIDATLPKRLLPTPYGRMGDLGFFGLMVLTGLGVYAIGRRRTARALPA